MRALRKTLGAAEGAVVDASILRTPKLGIAYARERTRVRPRPKPHDEEMSLGHNLGEAGEHLGEAADFAEPIDPDLADHLAEAGEHFATAAEGLEEEEAEERKLKRFRTDSRVFSIVHSLDITGKRVVGVQQARAVLDAARLEIAAAELALVRDIKATTAEYLMLSHGMPVIHNVVYGIKPQMWEATKDASGDRLRAEAYFLGLQQHTRGERQQLMRLETELNTLLGLPADTRLLIQDELDTPPIPVSYEALRESVLSSNLSVQAKLAQLRAARYAVGLAMRDRAPEVATALTLTKTETKGPSGTSVTRGTGLAASAAASLFQQLIEQNRGRVAAAKASEAAARRELQHARWEVENELYGLYQDLNLTRTQIQVMEHGLLPKLQKVVEEADADDYGAKRIEFNTWETHVRQYHESGEVLLNLKARYLAALASLGYVAGGSFTPRRPPPAESEEPGKPPAGYVAGIATKSTRGVGNVLLSPMEVPACWYGNIRDRGVLGILVGPVEGAITAVDRAATGAFDVVTFAIPWPLDRMEPVSQPVWDENPWTGTWSLRYFHPPVQYPQPDDDQEKGE